MKKIIGLLLLLTVSLRAQIPHAINYSIEEGLPSSNVYDVFQDSKNYIWFATDVGLVRFNGHDFVHFNTDDGLADNEVFKIYEDRAGRIWFLTLNGRLSFFRGNRFYNEKNTPYLKTSKLSGMLQAFFNDRKGNVFIADRTTNIYKLSPKNEKTESTQLAWQPNQSDNTFIFSTLEAHDKTPRFLTYKGIINEKGDVLYGFDKAMVDNVFSRGTHLGQTFYFNSGNAVYSLTEKQLVKLFTIAENTSTIISVDIDRHNNFWIGTRKGVYFIQPSKTGFRFRRFFNELSITKVLLDKDGNYWLSSLEAGVFMIPDMSVLTINGFQNKKISKLEVDPNRKLWAGNFDGIYYHFDHKKIQTYTIDLPVDKNIIKDFLFTPKHTYIIGNQGSVIRTADSQKAIKIGGNTIHSDKKGNLWWGSIVAFRITEPEINSKNYYDLVSWKEYIKRLHLLKRTNVIVDGNDDDLWLGTNFGLYKYTPKDSIVSYNKMDGFNASIEDLYFDKQQNVLLAATNSQGVILMRNDEIVGHFTKRSNLSNNTCKTICKAGANSYWIGTNTGLDKIYYANGKYHTRSYSASLALDGSKINDIETINDTVYLATNNGIIYFNQYKKNQRQMGPFIHLTDFSVNSKSLSFGKKMRLDYDQNELTISYDGISFLNSENLKYHYKLEGADENWFTTNNSQINYKALAPGDYIFKVYLTDALNNKSSTREIRFRIDPPYWKTIPFLLLFLLLSMAILLYIWRMRLRKLERRFNYERKAIQAERDKANLEKEMVELEQKALRLQMNPHFIFNALNTIKGYYAEGNDVKASDYISKFSKLLRMLLENTEQLIPLSKEIEMLKLYIALTQIRYKNKFDFSIETTPNLNPDDTAIPALLLQPMVENAIIHGLAPKTDKGFLLVRFDKTENLLICVVEDDGVGRTASQKMHKEYISKATEITTDRIALLKNESTNPDIEIIDLADENQNPTGTKVIISIPLTTIW